MNTENHFLRVGVQGGGCAGFSYSLGFDEITNIDKLNDTQMEFEGLKVVSDSKSLLYLEGTTLDFYDGIERRGFVFSNPNSTGGCGCGNSFKV